MVDLGPPQYNTIQYNTIYIIYKYIVIRKKREKKAILFIKENSEQKLVFNIYKYYIS